MTTLNLHHIFKPLPFIVSSNNTDRTLPALPNVPSINTNTTLPILPRIPSIDTNITLPALRSNHLINRALPPPSFTRFPTPSNTTQFHTRKHHLFEPTKHMCQQCSKVFQTSRHLRKHAVIHQNHRSKNYKCQLCSKHYYTKHGLSNHQAMRPDCASLEHICSWCGKGFAAFKSFNRHELAHQIYASEKYKCNFCGTPFKASSELIRHTCYAIPPTAINKKKFSCDLCYMSTNHQHALSRHELTSCPARINKDFQLKM
ncbi:uncharacterized protein EAF01_003736 [Botrytis porri]|uniref:uncharacterized protein n=1 Tax=Botrytis porri TaxID=87229 RepID=UPI0018FF26CB|nr:uncharacterized protein EAF01_003736 [Botrytis porri]KAF7910018.1 hypothetical protein EAF01_003736 [Botrytis porri]